MPNISLEQWILLFGIISGFLQVLGYTVYIRESFRKEIDPNPATWLMFSYGTSLLAILEWDRDASLALLALPVACAGMSIIVAILCWLRGTLRWPRDWESQWAIRAFIADVGLTTAYFVAWVLNMSEILAEEGRSIAALVFLIGSNVTTFTAFTPILQEVYESPQKERALPWIVWTLAYTTLGVATILESGFWTELLIYPVCCTFLHGAIAWLARPERRLLRLSRAAK